MVRSSYFLRLDLDDATLHWRLSRADSGEVVASAEEPTVGLGSAELANLLRKTAVKAVGNGSALQGTELSGWSADDLGNVCILRAELAMASRDPKALAASAACLEQTLLRKGDVSDVHASLATLYMFLNRLSGEPGQQRAMIAHANRAVELSPTSGRAALGQMNAYYQTGRIGEAVAAGKRAIELGSANPETVSKASLVIYLSGRWDEGVKLADDARSKAGVYKPVGASLVHMLDAYRLGDLRRAVRLVNEAAKPDPVATLVKLAALQKLNASSELADTISKARNQYPDFDQILLSVANSKRFEPSLAASLGDPLLVIARDVRWSTGRTAISSH